jgi:acetolactate synthase-1/2/3 large subunit
LGAAAALPERQVYCIIGDGAMGFHPQEIETAVRNNLKVVYIVVSDKQWGMVKLTQELALKPWNTLLFKKLSDKDVINADLGEIHWDDLARSMGAFGARAATVEELVEALERAQAADTCAVVHVDVHPVKHKWVPGLIDFKKMHQEPKGK